jgi:hypothetical protein
MNLALINLLAFVLLGNLAWAQLQEPKSDPTFNESHPQTSQADFDDAPEVQLKRTPGPVDAEITNEDIAPPQRHVIIHPNDSPAPAFSVTRVRVDGKKTHTKSILLLTPAHNTIYTPGVITFSWKYAILSKKKVAVILKVERLDGKKKYARKVFREKKLLDLSPGAYKWQVSTLKPGHESRWRIFKVEDTKSHSLTELYNGPTQSKKAKKPIVKPEVTAIYIKEVPDPNDITADGEDSDDNGIEADDTEPLQIPDSLRRVPAADKIQSPQEPQLVAPPWVKKN